MTNPEKIILINRLLELEQHPNPKEGKDMDTVIEELQTADVLDEEGCFKLNLPAELNEAVERFM